MGKEFLLITGASSGIGRKTAEQLSEQYALILSGRNEQELKQTLQICRNKDWHLIWQADLMDLSSLKSDLAKFIESDQVKISGFIHCAGMMKVLHAKAIDSNNISQIFNVNCFSAFEIISLLVNKRYNEGHLKHIIFISAILSEYGARGHNLYSASKAALNGFAKSLAVELAPKVRVNTVLPGGVKTPMSKAAYDNPEIYDKAMKEYPLGIGEPADIAGVISFLLSDMAKWITGQQFIVDGGRSINLTH